VPFTNKKSIAEKFIIYTLVKRNLSIFNSLQSNELKIIESFLCCFLFQKKVAPFLKEVSSLIFSV